MERTSDQTTLVAAVAEEIRRAIIRRELAPGSVLREAELADLHKVSRGTLREALRSLQDEGLVEVVPFRGAFVPRLSAKRAREVFSVRAELEPWALRLAMEQQAFSERDLREMESLVHQMDECQERGDAYNHAIADFKLHMIICERSDHELLAEIIRTLRWKTILYQAQVVTQDTSHAKVLQAIRAGAPQPAADAMKKHIIEAGERLVEALKLDVENDGGGPE